MKISIYAPYVKERFETARQHSFLHPERIAGKLGKHPVPRARSGGRLDADPVVYGRPNTLFATPVTLGCLNGHVP